MSTNEARTPAGEEQATVMSLRRSPGFADTPELIRAAEGANRDCARRVAEDAGGRCLPRLHNAVIEVERGRQLLEVARFGGAEGISQALAEALDQLAGAARR